jgi:glutamate-1-semialdehyde 2,1-aminomutase
MSSNTEMSSIREEDSAFFESELETFVPDRFFDAHCHLWHQEAPNPDFTFRLPEGVPYTVNAEQTNRFLEKMHRRSCCGILFIGVPVRALSKSNPHTNAWVSENVSTVPNCRGLFCVKPGDDPEWVRQQIRELGLHGLKPYHTWSKTTPTWQSEIPDFLPESLMKVADEEGWVITLHIVKSNALADPSNIHWIRRYCETYPNMKLILAHSARGFQAGHNLKGLPELTGLDNLYFDTSANCESIAHEAILKIIGSDNLLYGTDFFVSHYRGKCLSVADSFVWLFEDNPVWDDIHQQVKPVLVGLESLRSLKWACWSAGLKDTQIEDIFYRNATKLFGL